MRRAAPSRPRAPGLCGLAFAAALLAASPGLAANSFYSDRLREGGLAFERGEAARAARELRIACFGLLDDPRLLSECLARLALAEDKQGNAEGFREVFRRLSEVEERFGGYSQSALPADVRASFEKRAAAVLPPALLQQAPPALRLAGGTAAPPVRPRPAAPEVVPPVAVTPRPAPSVTAATAAASLSPLEQGQLAEVRRTLSQPAEVRALSTAFDVARGVADAHPASVEAQHLAAEAAYRINRFKEAAEYFQRGGDPGDKAAELLFYQAVAFFELGSRAEAASALKRALPNLRRTPYVDGYAKKILGQ
jgi:hypothetical protein